MGYTNTVPFSVAFYFLTFYAVFSSYLITDQIESLQSTNAPIFNGQSYVLAKLCGSDDIFLMLLRIIHLKTNMEKRISRFTFGSKRSSEQHELFHFLKCFLSMGSWNIILFYIHLTIRKITFSWFYSIPLTNRLGVLICLLRNSANIPIQYHWKITSISVN